VQVSTPLTANVNLKFQFGDGDMMMTTQVSSL